MAKKKNPLLKSTDLVDNIDLSKFITCNSSNLASYYYKVYDIHRPGNLYIRFKNDSVYKYNDVPKYLYEGLKDADSKGTFFTTHIKDKFSYKKLS